MPSLFQLVDQYRSLELLDPSVDLPPEVIKDTLEALGGDLEVKATNVGKYLLNLEYMAEAVEGAAKQMKTRAERIRDRAASLREYLRINMNAVGITKIEATEFVLSIKKNPAKVIIEDESQIPADFKRTPEPAPPPVAVPDKARIAEALKASIAVPGARLEQGNRLEVKI